MNRFFRFGLCAVAVGLGAATAVAAVPDDYSGHARSLLPKASGVGFDARTIGVPAKAPYAPGYEWSGVREGWTAMYTRKVAGKPFADVIVYVFESSSSADAAFKQGAGSNWRKLTVWRMADGARLRYMITTTPSIHASFTSVFRNVVVQSVGDSGAQSGSGYTKARAGQDARRVHAAVHGRVIALSG
jgi:hypothetical protein